MSKLTPAWQRPMPRFSVGDVVDVKIGPIGVMTPGNYSQGTVTEVRNYKAGPVYTVLAFDGTVVKAEECDTFAADK